MQDPNEIGSDAWTIEQMRVFNERLLAQVEELKKMVEWRGRSIAELYEQLTQAEEELAASETSVPGSDKKKEGE